MNKIKFSFKNHFIHRIYAYILAVVIIPSLVTYGVILRTNPKPTEMFTAFVEANVIDNEQFKSFLKDNTNAQNKEITLYSSLSSMSTYEVIFQTQGIESDILILSDAAFKNDYASYFLEISETNKYYSPNNKIVADKHYGIQIYDGGKGYLSNYIKYNADVNYYIFINKESVHTSKFSSDGQTLQIYDLLGAIYG